MLRYANAMQGPSFDGSSRFVSATASPAPPNRMLAPAGAHAYAASASPSRRLRRLIIARLASTTAASAGQCQSVFRLDPITRDRPPVTIARSAMPVIHRTLNVSLAMNFTSAASTLNRGRTFSQ